MLVSFIANNRKQLQLSLIESKLTSIKNKPWPEFEGRPFLKTGLGPILIILSGHIRVGPKQFQNRLQISSSSLIHHYNAAGV